MRRSYAPSQVRQRTSLGNPSKAKTQHQACGPGPAHPDQTKQASDSTTTIQRMPLFGFLSIPNDLKKQFKIPTGCVISEESIALRKTKTLGVRRSLPLVVPGGYIAPLPRVSIEDNSCVEEEDSGKGSEFPPHEPVVLWRDPEDENNVVQVIPQLACRLRPHQREGVQFLFECTMGLRGFEGEGCILADDMGLGKTLMSLTLLWTLLNQGITNDGKSAVQKAIVVCPTSLVGNWENELRKWIGDHCPTFAVKSDPQKMIKNFICHRNKGILIISYETQRRYCDLFTANNGKGLGGYTSCCELLICDEAHKLKNADSGLSKSLTLLPARKRVLLSGTPMQNELTEFFNMVNFCNPNVLGSLSHFRKKYENPILRAREPDASPRHVEKAELLQKELSTIVNEFILKRGNILNAQHLPPKLVQFVCCKLTPLQEQLYECVLNSKESRHLRDGKQTNTLNSLRHMLSICSHPDLILSSYRQKHAAGSNSAEDEVLEELHALMVSYNASSNGPKSAIKAAPSPSASKGGLGGRADRAAMRKIKMSNGFGGMSSARSGFDPERSGKFLVLFRLMSTLRNTSRDRIVIVSNTTQTLDLVESMCNDNNWPQLRLDGSIAAQKRTKLVDTFNDPMTNSFAFLLSSKAGGCGINLIGGNRLVMMDPDWNPASDKQAAARIWREGQKKRCYIYRLMSTCTIEEKIIQRQLSKEGLQSIVDNTDQVNTFSSNELKSLFQRDNVLDTRSNTHDTLRCKRCKCVTQISSSSHKNGNNALLLKHANVCVTYLTKIIESIETIVSVNVAAKMGNENIESDAALIGGQRADIPYTLDIKRVKDELENEDINLIPYKNVPELSKRIRTVMVGVDQDLKDEFGVQNVTLFNDFVASWTDLVPVLQDISKQHKKEVNRASKNETAMITIGDKENDVNGVSFSNRNDEGNADDEVDDDGDEYVEQEGCPEEEDFNRWSHHSSVRTCYGDESLQKAMSMGDNDDHGDNTISFVFGLEVNWDLLQEKLAKNAERDEQRRQQVEADLRALNKEREKVRRRSRGESTESGDDCDGDNSVAGDNCDIVQKNKTLKKKSKKRQRPLSPSLDSTGLDNALYIDVGSDDDDVFCEDNIIDDAMNIEHNKHKKQRKKKKSNKERTKENFEHRSCDSAVNDVNEIDTSEPMVFEDVKHKVITSETNKRMKMIVFDDSDEEEVECQASEDNGKCAETKEVRRRTICSDSDSDVDQSSEFRADDRGTADVSPMADKANESFSDQPDEDFVLHVEVNDNIDDEVSAEECCDAEDKIEGTEEQSTLVQGWNCVSCTFLNMYPARLCEVCGYVKISLTMCYYIFLVVCESF